MQGNGLKGLTTNLALWCLAVRPSQTLILYSVFISARSKFWGVSGSEDRGGGDNSIQFINFGRVGDKSFKEWRQKMGEGGGRVDDNSILTFVLLYSIKNVTFLSILTLICLSID